MNIRQFEYVLAVVDFKNFELAAERCFVTQSTLSTMINRFEEEIGIKIFNRKKKPVALTKEGEYIVQRLRILIHEVEALKNAVHELKGEVVGEVKIGIIPTIAPFLLPLFINRFIAAFPKVKLTIKEMPTHEIQRALKIRSLDIGILALPLNDPELNEMSLYDEPFLIYNSSETVYDASISIDRLDYSKLCLLEDGHCLRTQVQKICSLSDQFSQRDPNFQFDSGSMDSLFRVTQARNGITIVPLLASLDLREVDQKKLVNFTAPIPVRKVGLVTHRHFVKKKLLQGLHQLIRESVQHLIPLMEEKNVVQPL